MNGCEFASSFNNHCCSHSCNVVIIIVLVFFFWRLPRTSKWYLIVCVVFFTSSLLSRVKSCQIPPMFYFFRGDTMFKIGIDTCVAASSHHDWILEWNGTWDVCHFLILDWDNDINSYILVIMMLTGEREGKKKDRQMGPLTRRTHVRRICLVSSFNSICILQLHRNRLIRNYSILNKNKNKILIQSSLVRNYTFSLIIYT